MAKKKKSKFDLFVEKVEKEFEELKKASTIPVSNDGTPKLLSEQLEIYRGQLEETNTKINSIEELIKPIISKDNSTLRSIIEFLFK